MRRRVLVGFALLLNVLASTRVWAQLGYLRKDIPIDERPYTLVVGDLNGDGRLDLALSTWRAQYVLLNAEGGNFGPPVRTDTLGFGSVLAAADIDGDGKDDLVGGQKVLLSRGDGTFQPAASIGTSCGAVAVADLNRDGKSDLVCGFLEMVQADGRTQNLKGTRVLLGNGDGTFRSGPTLPTASPSPPPFVADFNGDGFSDVALFFDYFAVPAPGPGDPGYGVVVFPGRGDGTFGPLVQSRLGDTPVWGGELFHAADFNLDGVPDLATPYGVMLGRGNGTFEAAVPYSCGQNPVVSAADLNGDRTLEVLGRRGGSSLIVCPATGDSIILPAGLGANRVAVADLDGDGRLDIATANYSANTVTVLLAKPQSTPGLRRAVSAASAGAIVAPESLATVFATTPATTSVSASPPWPTNLGGVSLEVRDSAGAVRLAPLLYVSATQINFQVPAGTATGEAMLTIARGGDAVEGTGMQVDSVAPGIFMTSYEGEVPAATAVRVEDDGSHTPLAVFRCSNSSCQAEPLPLSTAGDRPIYLSFYGTGFRGAGPDNVTCSIWNVPVSVTYAGPQGTPGLDQINVRLPSELLHEIEGQLAGPGPVTITFWINGTVSNSAVIDVR